MVRPPCAVEVYICVKNLPFHTDFASSVHGNGWDLFSDEQNCAYTGNGGNAFTLHRLQWETPVVMKSLAPGRFRRDILMMLVAFFIIFLQFMSMWNANFALQVQFSFLHTATAHIFSPLWHLHVPASCHTGLHISHYLGHSMWWATAIKALNANSM